MTRSKSGRKLAETDVMSQVKDWLALRGWRAVRMQRTIIPGRFQTGEPGMPDYVFVRYIQELPGLSTTLWVELKATGAKARCICIQNYGTRKRCTACDQRTWREAERARGALVWTVDSLAWLEREYEAAFGFLDSTWSLNNFGALEGSARS